MNKLIVIFIAGGLGSICRYTLGMLIQQKMATNLPAGTISVNLIGCFIIGIAAALGSTYFTTRPNLQLAIMVGFLGGFTTFSSFGLESTRLLMSGQTVNFWLNVLISNVGGILATLVGYKITDKLL